MFLERGGGVISKLTPITPICMPIAHSSLSLCLLRRRSAKAGPTACPPLIWQNEFVGVRVSELVVDAGDDTVSTNGARGLPTLHQRRTNDSEVVVIQNQRTGDRDFSHSSSPPFRWILRCTVIYLQVIRPKDLSLWGFQ